MHVSVYKRLYMLIYILVYIHIYEYIHMYLYRPNKEDLSLSLSLACC